MFPVLKQETMATRRHLVCKLRFSQQGELHWLAVGLKPGLERIA
jgi:hypothetical protein